MEPTTQGHDDDRASVDRVLAGDTDAFEDIVRRWQGPLVNLAYRFCRERAMAEEMAQEVFLKVFRNLARWRRDARFSSWIFSVALNHYRSAMRRHVPPMTDLSGLEAVAATSDLAQEMDAAAADELVRRAVTLLPEKYRDVVLVYYFQHKDVAETARTVRLKEGTVKARLHRARKLLEKKLRVLQHPRAQAAQET